MKGAQWMDIRSDRQKGLSYVELGRKYHMDPRTAKRYAESPQKPEYTLSEPKPTKMDPYKQIVDEWLGRRRRIRRCGFWRNCGRWGLTGDTALSRHM